MNRDGALKVVLVIEYEQMILGVYATLGIFLLLAWGCAILALLFATEGNLLSRASRPGVDGVLRIEGILLHPYTPGGMRRRG